MDINTILFIVITVEITLAFAILGRTVWVTRDQNHPNHHRRKNH